MSADVVSAVAGTVAYQCDAGEARRLTDEIKGSAERTYRLLLNAHRWGAWSALGYASWRDYARAEFGMSQSRAYQLLDQARIVTAIEDASGSTSVEITEAQARDLKPHLPAVVEAVRAATSDLPDEERPAAAVEAVRAIREQVAPPRAHVTETTRTTETTKVEQDVDLTTGEILTDPPSEDDPVESFLSAQVGVQQQMLRANVQRALVAANHLADHDAANVAAAVSDGFMDDLTAVLSRITTWAEAVRSARPRGLRVVGGSK